MTDSNEERNADFSDINADGKTIYYKITSPVTVEVIRSKEKNYRGDIVIPDTVNNNGIIYRVTAIEEWAFWSCNGLTSVSIGNSVTDIEEWAFWGCSGLISISVDENNTAYSSKDGVLFNKNQTHLIYCPAGRTGSYTIPNSVTSIGEWAFCKCSDLTSVSIGNSVTAIGDFAFDECIGLTEIYVKTINPPSIEDNTFEGVSNSIPVYVPACSVEDYRKAEGWSEFTNVINSD